MCIFFDRRSNKLFKKYQRPRQELALTLSGCYEDANNFRCDLAKQRKAADKSNCVLAGGSRHMLKFFFYQIKH